MFEMYAELYDELITHEDFSEANVGVFYSNLLDMLSPYNELSLSGKVAGLYCFLKDYGGYNDYCNRLYNYMLTENSKSFWH